MSKQTLSQLKAWFSKGLYPTQSQFWDWMDSFFHKDEAIPMTSVDGLADAINSKAETSTVQTITQEVASVDNRVTNLEKDKIRTFETIDRANNVADLTPKLNKIFETVVLDFSWQIGEVVELVNDDSETIALHAVESNFNDGSYLMKRAFLHSDTKGFATGFFGSNSTQFMLGDQDLWVENSGLNMTSDNLKYYLSIGNIHMIFSLIFAYNVAQLGYIPCNVNTSYNLAEYFEDFPDMMTLREIDYYINHLIKYDLKNVVNSYGARITTLLIPITDRMHIESTNGNYKDSYVYMYKFVYVGETDTYQYNGVCGMKMGIHSSFAGSYYFYLFCQKKKQKVIPVNITLNVEEMDFSKDDKATFLIKPSIASYITFTSSSSVVEFRPKQGFSSEKLTGSITLPVLAGQGAAIELEYLPYKYNNFSTGVENEGKTILISFTEIGMPITSDIEGGANAVHEVDNTDNIDGVMGIYESN